MPLHVKIKQQPAQCDGIAQKCFTLNIFKIYGYQKIKVYFDYKVEVNTFNIYIN